MSSISRFLSTLERLEAVFPIKETPIILSCTAPTLRQALILGISPDCPQIPAKRCSSPHGESPMFRTRLVVESLKQSFAGSGSFGEDSSQSLSFGQSVLRNLPYLE